MNAIQIISQDVFDKVRSRFQNLEMGDETGAITLDPAQARFFDFDFVYEGTDLGRVSISLADRGSLKIYYSQGITEDQDDVSKQIWYDFLKEMRMFAKRRLLRFDTRDISKTNLDKNDFQHLAATQAPKEEDAMKNTMNESKWKRHTPKTSRAVKGGTQVVVRYKESMEGKHPSLRSSKKYIQGIYVENNLGERFKYPFEHLQGALAMGMHVEHGGRPYDKIGEAIIGMSEEIAKLNEFQKLVHSATLHDDANQIKERAVSRLTQLKEKIQSLSKRRYYEQWVAEFNEKEYMNDGLTMDDVTMEEYKAKFTETNFIENLVDYFPLLHKIMSEENKIDLEDYVKEEDAWKVDTGWKKSKSKTPASTRGPGRVANLSDKARKETEKKAQKAPAESFETFEEWAEAVEQGQLTPDVVEKLKQEIPNLPDGKLELGVDGESAIKWFNGLGLENAELEDKIRKQSVEDSTFDGLKLLKTWAIENNLTQLLQYLADLLPKDPEPAAEPQVAEPPKVEDEEEPYKEMKNKSLDEMIKEIVQSRFNLWNEAVGPFNGHEGILLDVEKAVKERFSDRMNESDLEVLGEKARSVAENWIQKLSEKYMKLHSQKNELNRIRELANIKR